MLGGSPFDGRSRSAAEVSPVFSSCPNARSRRKVPTPDRGRVDRSVIRQPRLSPHPSGHYIGYGLWLTNDGTEGATSGPRRADLRVNPTPDTGGWKADVDPELGDHAERRLQPAHPGAGGRYSPNRPVTACRCHLDQALQA